MNFVFQKSFSQHMDQDGEELKQICNEVGINFYPITIRPFEHTVVEEKTVSNLTEYTVAYGSNAMEDVVKQYGWNPGWFYTIHDEVGTYAYFGDEYINHDMMVCRTDNYIESLKQYDMYDFEYYFMKPNDQKYFPGTIVDKPMIPFVIESQGKHHGTPDVYDICISPVKKIVAEWRFFVVRGNIVTGSKYHAENLRLDIQPGYEAGAHEYAQSMVDIYDKTGTFVIDIAKMESGKYKVVEINCLNSSGFYMIDKKKLITGLYETSDC
jgi:hypothetical protein